MSSIAVIAARNEAGYIQTSLRTLIEDEGLEVILIDNGSVDGTRELAAAFLGRGVQRIVDLEWTGRFDLEASLRVKAAIVREVRHDWVLHLDADEWPRAVTARPLASFLASIPPRWSVVNFEEFVFLPPQGRDLWALDFRRHAVSYYYFAPSPLRLMRAWRRKTGASNVMGAGHRLDVDEDQVYPEPQVLRHYIGLSWSQAVSKRADRTYSDTDIARGWHSNRLDMRASQPVYLSPKLRVADPWDARQLDRSAPSAHHFWEQGFDRG